MGVMLCCILSPSIILLIAPACETPTTKEKKIQRLMLIVGDFLCRVTEQVLHRPMLVNQFQSTPIWRKDSNFHDINQTIDKRSSPLRAALGPLNQCTYYLPRHGQCTMIRGNNYLSWKDCKFACRTSLFLMRLEMKLIKSSRSSLSIPL